MKKLWVHIRLEVNLSLKSLSLIAYVQVKYFHITTLHEHMLTTDTSSCLKLIHPTCHIIHIITCMQPHTMELVNHKSQHRQCVHVEECYWLSPLCVINMTFHKSSARNSTHSLHSNIKFLKFLYFVGSKTPYTFTCCIFSFSLSAVTSIAL